MILTGTQGIVALPPELLKGAASKKDRKKSKRRDRDRERDAERGHEQERSPRAKSWQDISSKVRMPCDAVLSCKASDVLNERIGIQR